MSHFLSFDDPYQICFLNDLSTCDPYDIWKTRWGLLIKRKFYRGGFVTKGIAGMLTIGDLFLNNKLRLGYRKQEYAVVRALAAQILAKQYLKTGNEKFLSHCNQHIRWLLDNSLKTSHGIGWGLDFEHPWGAGVYSKDTPYSTITPYALEALLLHEKALRQEGLHKKACSSIFNFFDKDIQVLERSDTFEVTSYGPMHDRRVVNAVSYTMYSLILLDKYFNFSKNTHQRVQRLYNYIKEQQQADGSWYYSDEGESFIDCFHSCIVLKNLIKSKRLGVQFDGIDEVIRKGYTYLKSWMWDNDKGLYKRFSKTNKPALIKYDLYDNAEMLQCAVLMNDDPEAKKIAASIKKHFIVKNSIYSGIDFFGTKRNRNMLRWAVLPYLYSLNMLEQDGRQN